MYNVIIVDDNRFAVNAIKSKVDWEKLNVSHVLVAYDATDAKVLFNSNRIDLILCDIEMPGQSGLQLASWICRYFRNTIIIFLTCHTDFLYAQEAIRYGAFEYIVKPCPIDDLTQVIQQALNHDPNQYFYDRCSSEIEQQLSITQKVIQYIKNNLGNDLSRENIAKHVHLSEDYLSKLFKKETKVSLNSYIINQRIERSKHYLISSNIPISEIAVKVGLKNTSHFIQTFKKETGVTPLIFKKQYFKQ